MPHWALFESRKGITLRGTGASRLLEVRGVAALVALALLAAACGGDDGAEGAPGPGGGAPSVVTESAPTGAAGASSVPAPDERGPHAVGRLTLELTDAERGRTLPVDLWYPTHATTLATASPYVVVGDISFTGSAQHASPVALGGHPLVVFSHAYDSRRFQSYSVMELLASHGFLVAAPDHVGSTTIEAVAGGADTTAVAHAKRVEDVGFVVQALLEESTNPEGELGGRVDGTRTAVVGHSLGAASALAFAGGAGSAADGGPVPGGVKAVVALAPRLDVLDPGQLAAVTAPTLLVGGTRDATQPIEESIVPAFEQVGAETVVRVDVEGAAHASFSDVCHIVEVLRRSTLEARFRAPVEAAAEETCGDDVLGTLDAQRALARSLVPFLMTNAAGDDRYGDLLGEGGGVSLVRR
jgi:predicted dienelactone hydrolase